MKEAGIYIHFPFCKSRCCYCDFSTAAGCESLISPYCIQVAKEIELYARKYQNLFAIRTIYLGGGSPSYLPNEFIEKIIRTITKSFFVPTDVEISIEANPADITLEKSQRWKECGINRISVGMQSAQEKELKMLGRRHSFEEVLQAVKNLRECGWENFNLDLMFGLPQQSLVDWQDSIRKALDLSPTHLSLYALMVEEGTPLFQDMEKGVISMPDEDLAADMYEWVMDFLAAEGFEQYEISNWAKKGSVDYRCQHNLLYWRNGNYFGFGASAHSHIDNLRWANQSSIFAYIQSLSEYGREEKMELPLPWVETFTPLTQKDDMSETAIMGLRLTQDGLRDDLFQEKFAKSLFTIYEKQISQCVKWGLLEVVESEVRAVRLTKRGRMLGNQVFLQFLLD